MRHVSLLAAGLLLAAGCAKPPEPQWEYRVVAVGSEGHDRTEGGALRFASVTPDQADFNRLGAEGWELVSSYLEMETAFPNFGNSSYVTGLQPNIRPQRVVFVFKRHLVSPPQAAGPATGAPASGG